MLHHALVFVKHYETTRAHHRAGLESAIGETFISHHSCLTLCCLQQEICRNDGNRRSTGNTSLKPSSICYAAAIFIAVDEFFNGNSHVYFVNARLVDVSAGRNEFGACGLSNSNLCVFFSAFVYDWYNCSDCLNVVDHGRTIPESFHGWERRLDPRISALTFERFEQRSFFSADVRTCTAMHENFTVESRSEYVLA